MKRPVYPLTVSFTPLHITGRNQYTFFFNTVMFSVEIVCFYVRVACFGRFNVSSGFIISIISIKLLIVFGICEI
jgi:hypothetical protein